MLKKCCICELDFPSTIEFFHRRKSSIDGLRCDCKSCRKEKKKKDYSKPLKKCSNCNIEKPNTNEYFHIKNGGLRARNRSLCKECHKRWCRKNHLLKKYKISEEDYDNLYKEQEGKCKICNVHYNSLVIDHNHNTNQVRSLLCDNCNTGIGMLKENIEIMKSAIEYLKYHNTKTN